LPTPNDDHETSADRAVPSNATASRDGAGADGVVDIDVSWLVPADLSAVDTLARLQIAASRCGRWLRFHGADGGLAELLEFVGLGDVVHLCRSCPWCLQRGQPPTARG
jgi:hypothetical protein